MSNINLATLETLHLQLEVLMKEPLVDEESYQSVISEIDRIQMLIESDLEKYGSTAKKMINLCLLMKFKLETKVSEVLEEQYRKRYIN
jgi:hypothetical protein